MALKIKRYRFVKYRFVFGFGFWIDDMNLLDHGYDGRTVTILLPCLVYQLRAIAVYDEKELKLRQSVARRERMKASHEKSSKVHSS